MTIDFEKSSRSLVSIFGIFLALFIVSCEDDDHAHEEEHTDAEGFILASSSETEVYREFKGIKTGSIILNAGETLELSVHFLGDDGKELEHEEHEGKEEEEAELRVSGFNASVATVEFEKHHDDGGDEEYGMALKITGVSTGSTSFKLKLMHDEHADYTSTNNVPITVQ